MEFEAEGAYFSALAHGGVSAGLPQLSTRKIDIQDFGK